MQSQARRVLTGWHCSPIVSPLRLYTVISSILKLGVITDARKVETMDEPGEVYEFLFVYRSRRMYSKVNLCDGKVSVLVYSAHLQRFGNIQDGRFA